MDNNPMCTFIFANKPPVRKKRHTHPRILEFEASMIVADDGRVIKNAWAWQAEGQPILYPFPGEVI